MIRPDYTLLKFQIEILENLHDKLESMSTWYDGIDGEENWHIAIDSISDYLNKIISPRK